MEEKNSCKGIIYKVKKGDTLYMISRMYGVKVRDIMLANPYVNIYQLMPGDELCIPMVGETSVIFAKPYIVGKAETLASVMKKTGLTCEELLKTNPQLGDLQIKEGTVLIVKANKKN